MVALMKSKTDIAIIGDGLGAAMLVWHLADLGHDMTRVSVFGKGKIGYGKAYGSPHPDLRLNVRADLMNVTLDEGPGLAAWAVDHIHDDEAETDAGQFFRRHDFGRYIDNLIQPALKKGVAHIRATVRDITPPETLSANTSDHWRIMTDSGDWLARVVILAQGNPDPQPLIESPLDGVVTSPWLGQWPDTIKPNTEIAIIGSGLTAMDTLLMLQKMKHNGVVQVISPHGILPPRQMAWKRKDPLIWPKTETASAFVQVFADNLPEIPRETAEWQSQFERLRGGISAAWRTLPKAARRAVLAQYGSWWQTSRYRAGPQTSAAAQSMMSSGQLTMIKGRVTGLEPSSGCHTLRLSDGTSCRADHVILAVGTGRDPLTHQLIKRCHLGHDMSGLEVDRNLNPISTGGNPYHTLFAMGPQTAFSRGDIIGATGISREAKTVAEKLMEHSHV